MSDPNVYREQDWPHGLSCPECGLVLADGDRFSKVLTGFQEDVPVVLIVCTPCAMVTHA